MIGNVTLDKSTNSIAIMMVNMILASVKALLSTT
jgi:hypothetical protein